MILRIKQIKSSNGRLKAHKACLTGLGIRHMHHVVDRPATPEVLGMINKVAYMLEVQEIGDATKSA